MAEADIAMGAFDEAGDIGDGGAPVPGKIDDANDGVEGGERVRGDFRMRGGDLAEEGGFSGVRVADEAGIGDLAKLKVKFAAFAGIAFAVLARDTIFGALEMDVSFSAIPASAEDEFFAFLLQIRDEAEVLGGDAGAALFEGSREGRTVPMGR